MKDIGLGPFRLDAQNNLLLRGTEPLPLGNRAILLLRALVERPGELVSKDALIDAGWPGLAVEESNLTVQISALRRALGEAPDGDRWIETMPRRGYRFTGPVIAIEDPAPEAPPSIDSSRVTASLDTVAIGAAPERPVGDLLEYGALGSIEAGDDTQPIHGYSVLGDSLVASGRAGTSETSDEEHSRRPWFKRYWRLAVTLAGLLLVVMASTGIGIWGDHRFAAARKSIVVLPFSNFSGDPEQNYVADAITDDLTNDVGQLSDTFVIARSTAFTYKGKTINIRNLGSELGVRYALEGSVRKTATDIETNAELIDVSTGASIWADHFSNKVTDLEEMQQQITGRIALSLNTQLIRAAARRAAEDPSPDATDLRLRGIGLILEAYTPENALAARRLFEASAKLDPDNAETWAWLGDLIAGDVLNRWNGAGKTELAEARAAVEHALSLDSNLPLAQYAAGMMLRAAGDQEGSLAALNRAIELNPNYAAAYAQKGNALNNLGRPNEAPPLVEKALALNPRDPGIGIFYWIIGRANFYSERFADAIPYLERSVQSAPLIARTRLHLIAAYALTENQAKAHQALAEFKSVFPDYTLAQLTAYEKDFPLDNPVFVAASANLHEGLRRAGMPEQ